LEIAEFQDFEVFPPLATRLQAFRHSLSRPKGKKKKKNCKFEFRLNCKQRFMFYKGPLSDNKVMSVDAAQFWLCKNPINCLLSMNKSARRCVFCTASKT